MSCETNKTYAAVLSYLIASNFMSASKILGGTICTRETVDNCLPLKLDAAVTGDASETIVRIFDLDQRDTDRGFISLLSILDRVFPNLTIIRTSPTGSEEDISTKHIVAASRFRIQQLGIRTEIELLFYGAFTELERDNILALAGKVNCTCSVYAKKDSSEQFKLYLSSPISNDYYVFKPEGSACHYRAEPSGEVLGEFAHAHLGELALTLAALTSILSGDSFAISGFASGVGLVTSPLAGYESIPRSIQFQIDQDGRAHFIERGDLRETLADSHR